jgi:hypothetical protein
MKQGDAEQLAILQEKVQRDLEHYIKLVEDVEKKNKELERLKLLKRVLLDSMI